MPEMNEKLKTVAVYMSDFDFDIDDYFKATDEVMERAITHFAERSGISPCSPYTPTVEKYVNSLFEGKIAQAVSWAHIGPLNSGDVISFTIGAYEVEGIVDIAPKSVAVTMKKPCSGLRGGFQLSSLAPRIYTDEPFLGSPANEAGIVCAKSTLLDIYMRHRINSGRLPAPSSR